MGVLKRKVDSKAKGFTPYAGPEPKPGIYRARVVKGAIREASTGTLSYNVLFEFKATKPADKQYDGFDGFCEIWLGEKEASQAKEAAFIKAITGKDNFQTVNVAYTGKESDFKTQSGAEITGLDGVKLPNKIVNVHMRMEKARTGDDGKEYPARLRADSILPWKESEESDDEDEDGIDQVDDADVDEEDEDADAADTDEDEGDEDDDAGEEMSDEEWEAAKAARRKELKSREYDLAKLRGVLKENGVDTKGLKKDELVEAVLELEFPEGDDEDQEDIDENDVEVDEDAAESDESEEDEDEDEDEEDEDEEEEDEEGDDLRTEIEAEAAGLDRTALKREIKKLDAEAGFKKSETDDDLRERFVELKLNAPGF